MKDRSRVSSADSLVKTALSVLSSANFTLKDVSAAFPSQQNKLIHAAGGAGSLQIVVPLDIGDAMHGRAAVLLVLPTFSL